jgi:hypothetical protein
MKFASVLANTKSPWINVAQAVRNVKSKRPWAILLVTASAITSVPIAAADSCRNVDVLLDNKTSVRVKALYANFKCEGENEKKEMFKNVEVPETSKLPVATQQDLQSCKSKKMEYIEVHYKVRCGDGSWSNEKFIKDNSFLNAFCSSDAGKQ